MLCWLLLGKADAESAEAPDGLADGGQGEAGEEEQATEDELVDQGQGPDEDIESEENKNESKGTFKAGFLERTSLHANWFII